MIENINLATCFHFVLAGYFRANGLFVGDVFICNRCSVRTLKQENALKLSWKVILKKDFFLQGGILCIHF